MKKMLLFFALLASLQLSAQWNTLGWNPYLLRDTEGDSTFVLSAPSRTDLQEGVATWVPSPAASYKVYTALLTQSGTDAPVATVLENTLGGTVVWTRDNVGSYFGTLSGAFINNKTSRFACDLNNPGDGFGNSIVVQRLNDNQIVCYTGSRNGQEFLDDVLNYTYIEIRVYP